MSLQIAPIKRSLSLARLREVLNYDPTSGVFVWAKQLARRAKAGTRAGTFNAAGYRQIRIDNVIYYEHRLAWFFQTGTWPTHEVDHINLCKGDNRFANLRQSTHMQNCANRVRCCQPQSGLRGVTKKRDKWQARLRGKSLGCFSDPEIAHAAYAEAAKLAYGEFARVA